MSKVETAEPDRAQPVVRVNVGPQARGGVNPAITVQTQENMPEARVANMSDQELDTYEKLLLELRELLSADDPKKRIGAMTR